MSEPPMALASHDSEGSQSIASLIQAVELRSASRGKPRKGLAYELRADRRMSEPPMALASQHSEGSQSGIDDLARAELAPVEQAERAKERLALVEQRLRALSTDPVPCQPHSPHGPALRGAAARSIDDAVAMVEASLEDARVSVKVKVDKAVLVADSERARCEEVVAKAGEVKEAVAAMSRRVAEAREQCDACVRPFTVVDAASHVNAHRLAVSLNVDRAAIERRLAEAEAEVRRGREALYQVALRLHGFVSPISGEAVCPKPQEAHGMDELAQMCERALPALTDAFIEDDRASHRSGRARGAREASFPIAERAMDSKSWCTSLGTLSTSCMSRRRSTPMSARRREVVLPGRSQSLVSDSSFRSPDSCSRCAAALGFRRFNPRHWCDFCEESYCGSCCSTSLCVCFHCQGRFRNTDVHEANFDERMAKMKSLHETLRALGGRAGVADLSRHRNSKLRTSLDELISQCEALARPLKEMKTNQDMAKTLAQDVRHRLHTSAERATRMHEEYGGLLAALFRSAGEGCAGFQERLPTPMRNSPTGPPNPFDEEVKAVGWQIRDKHVEWSV